MAFILCNLFNFEYPDSVPDKLLENEMFRQISTYMETKGLEGPVKGVHTKYL